MKKLEREVGGIKLKVTAELKLSEQYNSDNIILHEYMQMPDAKMELMRAVNFNFNKMKEELLFNNLEDIQLFEIKEMLDTELETRGFVL